MLVVNKSQNNTLIVTLSEKSDVTYPYYLFEFKSDVTSDTKNFIATDRSNYTTRYNEFLITETSGTEILTSGTITLNPTGQWTYRIYGQYSSSNLVVANADSGVLEIGRVKVVGTATSFDTYNGTDNTYDVYEPS